MSSSQGQILGRSSKSNPHTRHTSAGISHACLSRQHRVYVYRQRDLLGELVRLVCDTARHWESINLHVACLSGRSRGIKMEIWRRALARVRNRGRLLCGGGGCLLRACVRRGRYSLRPTKAEAGWHLGRHWCWPASGAVR